MLQIIYLRQHNCCVLIQHNCCLLQITQLLSYTEDSSITVYCRQHNYCPLKITQQLSTVDSITKHSPHTDNLLRTIDNTILVCQIQFKNCLLQIVQFMSTEDDTIAIYCRQHSYTYVSHILIYNYNQHTYEYITNLTHIYYNYTIQRRQHNQSTYNSTIILLSTVDSTVTYRLSTKDSTIRIALLSTVDSTNSVY